MYRPHLRYSNSLALVALSACLMTACDDDEASGTASDETSSTPAQTTSSTTDATGATGTTGSVDTTDTTTSTGGMNPGVGGQQELAIAGQLLGEITDYPAWPGLATQLGVVPSMAPHGPFAQYYVNSIAAADPATLPAGSIVIKRNLMTQDPNSIDSVTVMQRIAGYNPAGGDWFWMKLTASGTVASNDAGVQLAGAVGPCIDCHTMAVGGDFVFKN